MKPSSKYVIFSCVLAVSLMVSFQNCGQYSVLEEESIYLSKMGLVGVNAHEANCKDVFMPVSINLTEQNLDELDLDNVDYEPFSLVFFCKRKKPIKDKNFEACININLDRKSRPDYHRDRNAHLILSKNGNIVNPHFSYMELSNENYEFDIYASFLENGETNENNRVYLKDNKTTIHFKNNCYK